MSWREALVDMTQLERSEWLRHQAEKTCEVRTVERDAARAGTDSAGLQQRLLVMGQRARTAEDELANIEPRLRDARLWASRYYAEIHGITKADAAARFGWGGLWDDEGPTT